MLFCFSSTLSLSEIIAEIRLLLPLSLSFSFLFYTTSTWTCTIHHVDDSEHELVFFFLWLKMRGPDGIKLKKGLENKKRGGKKSWMVGAKASRRFFFFLWHYNVFCSLQSVFHIIIGGTRLCWIKVLDFLRHYSLHLSFSHDLHCRFFILQTRKLWNSN